MNNNLDIYYRIEEDKRIQELLYKYPITEKHIEVLGKFILKTGLSHEKFKRFLEDTVKIEL